MFYYEKNVQETTIGGGTVRYTTAVFLARSLDIARGRQCPLTIGLRTALGKTFTAPAFLAPTHYSNRGDIDHGKSVWGGCDIYRRLPYVALFGRNIVE